MNFYSCFDQQGQIIARCQTIQDIQVLKKMGRPIVEVKEISDFRNIIKWRLRFFKLTKVSETCFDSEWKKDYYKALFPLNPNQIIPVLPSLKEIMQSLPK